MAGREEARAPVLLEFRQAQGGRAVELRQDRESVKHQRFVETGWRRGLPLKGPSAVGLRSRSLFCFCSRFDLCRAVPLKGAAETFFKTDLRIVAEEFARLPDVGLGVANVAVAGWFVLGFEFLAGYFRKELSCLVQRESVACPDVERFAGNTGGLARKKISLDGVFHVREVAGLLAVPKDDRLRLFQKTHAQFRQDAGVRRAGILARPENIEVAERNIFESVTAAKRLRVEFADEFSDAIG